MAVLYSSSSSPSSATTLKNFKLYSPLLVLTTRNQSLSCCFFRNFFVRYFRYRPLNSWCATTSMRPSPRLLTETTSPRLPVRPSTLMRCCRKVVKAEGSKMRSLVGWVALMMNCAFVCCGEQPYSSAHDNLTAIGGMGDLTFLVTFPCFFAPAPFRPPPPPVGLFYIAIAVLVHHSLKPTAQGQHSEIRTVPATILSVMSS